MTSATTASSEPDTTSAYEALRQHVFNDAPGRLAGWIVVLRDGLATWIEQRSQISPAPPVTPVRPTPRLASSSPPTSELSAHVVSMLATMALSQPTEVQL